MTLTSSAGEATLVLSGTGTPRPALRIPSFSAKASSTKKKRLTVFVTPSGGTIKNIVVQVRSRSGRLLGTGTRGSASRRAGVTVTLKSALGRGTYKATATGRDALKRKVTAKTLSFTLR
jgi:hypothetical protein